MIYFYVFLIFIIPSSYIISTKDSSLYYISIIGFGLAFFLLIINKYKDDPKIRYFLLKWF